MCLISFMMRDLLKIGEGQQEAANQFLSNFFPSILLLSIVPHWRNQCINGSLRCTVLFLPVRQVSDLIIRALWHRCYGTTLKPSLIKREGSTTTWSLILRLPSYAASQLPFLIHLSTACLQEWTVLPWVGCKTLSRHTEKKKEHKFSCMAWLD